MNSEDCERGKSTFHLLKPGNIKTQDNVVMTYNTGSVLLSGDPVTVNEYSLLLHSTTLLHDATENTEVLAWSKARRGFTYCKSTFKWP